MPKDFRFLIAALCLAIAAFAVPQVGLSQIIEPGEEGELLKFVPPKNGARACFSRVYDAEHLKKHPKQQVTEMEFRLAYYVHEPDEFTPKAQAFYYFELLAQTRGEKRSPPLSAGGACAPTEDGKAIFCGVDCDGGGVAVSRTGNAKKISDRSAGGGALRMTFDCGEGEEETVELVPGEDDKTFLLTRTADATCPAYEDW